MLTLPEEALYYTVRRSRPLFLYGQPEAARASALHHYFRI